MKKILLLLVSFLINYTVYSQTVRDISGVVKDSTGTGIFAATIKYIAGGDTTFTRSNTEGEFIFSGVKSSTFLLSLTSLGYQALNKRFLYNDAETPIKLEPIILKFENRLLSEVVISGTPGVTIKEDTIIYRAADYALRENALAEDLLKKLPGVEVDKDGNVTAQGKAITKVRVNGKDFFGGDVKTATQQLPANILESAQIIDDYGDQANLTGIRNGDPEKILNFTIRPDKNKGYFTNGTLGGGNKERYQASVTANSYNNTEQISFIGNLNNTNSSVFNFSGGGGFGGGGGGARVQQGGGGGGGMRFMGGGGGGAPQGGDGLTSVGSIGLNYRNDYGKKLSSYGNYSYSKRDNDILSNSFQQNNFRGGALISTNETSQKNAINNNHRLSWNLEYRPDSVNYIKFSPSFSYGGRSEDGNTSYIQNDNERLSSDGTTLSNTSSTNPNFGVNILLNHRFQKRGRNISLYMSANNSKTKQEDDQLTQYINYIASGGNANVYRNQELYDNNRNSNINSNLSYNEPLSPTTNLEFNYNHSTTNYRNDRETFDIIPGGPATLNTSLSNDYNYSFSTNRFGVNFRKNEKKYNYSFGLSAQPSILEGNSIVQGVNTPNRNTGFNFIPSARYSYNFSRTRAFNANYFGRANEPTYIQLQPTPDISNPQYPVYGNPDLNAEFSHILNFRYNNFNFNSGDVLFLNLSGNYTENKIVSNIIRSNDPAVGLVQETRYLNTNGYFTTNAFYNFSKPFQEKKYVFTLNGAANYINNISYTDDVKNTGKNWILWQGLNMRINPNKNLEFNPGLRYSFNTNTNDAITNNNTRVSTYTMSFNTKVYFLKSWLIGSDLSKSFNDGYSSSLAVNPFIINTYLEKQFFKDKRASLRLQGYDLLNENTSVSRSVTGNVITDSQSNRLSRYALLSFTMRIQKFSGTQPQQQPQERERGGFRPGGERHE